MTAMPPTKDQKERWGRIRALGCLINNCMHGSIEIHHCETGAGGRKNHDKVIPLCNFHHSPYAEQGIHRIGRKKWQEKYGTERELMDRVSSILGEMG